MFRLNKGNGKNIKRELAVISVLLISVVAIVLILALRYKEYNRNAIIAYSEKVAEKEAYEPAIMHYTNIEEADNKLEAGDDENPKQTPDKNCEMSNNDGDQSYKDNSKDQKKDILPTGHEKETKAAVTRRPLPSKSPLPKRQKADDKAGLESRREEVNKWLVDKLSPGGSAANEKRAVQTWIGWFFDRDCIGINPVKHTKSCNLMGSCYLSGLGIIPYVKGKPYTTYSSISDYKNFDESSRSIAKAFLESLPEDWKTNITVKVTGYPVNNIPANADETEVPETNPSEIDHYLEGIHITSIEAAYIEGVSTNKLPSTNIIFPKP
jgi:hypothetical protein